MIGVHNLLGYTGIKYFLFQGQGDQVIIYSPAQVLCPAVGTGAGILYE